MRPRLSPRRCDSPTALVSGKTEVELFSHKQKLNSFPRMLCATHLPSISRFPFLRPTTVRAAQAVPLLDLRQIFLLCRTTLQGTVFSEYSVPRGACRGCCWWV